ncbi:Gfo/Idh/MocA family oxidoreductase [Rugamonas sp. FT82W]|uniref:Gfo/Idh/MocA family oxidoreductase n=1 Tax=Duganella vulcania TaxID=2692166 RepID=A0A845G6Q3_9BURK|nr:Gfo/Idh/MocA family oxidoreductase [Duganella vulcania]MYM89300.1 Gfo/Idh/MocA family oxidoreductase [Duganella vulcania]
MNEKIRVGIVGAGTWAEYGHIPSLKLLPQYEIAAIFSRSQEKASQVAAQHGIKYALNSLEALVAHPEVDLVLVLNPAPNHERAIRAAIAAGKDVYSEWPLTPSKAVSQELMELADRTGVRHIVGLQRRLGPDYRYVRDLLRDGYIGELRSVRLHVSVEYFQQRRLQSLYFTVPAENFSSLLSIYGGHFFDAVFAMVGHPDSIHALTVNQFKEVTLIESGTVLPHTLADQVVVSGSFANGAVLTAHLEAGKRNNFGWQLDLTGSAGDLKISNHTSFGDAFNVIEGAQGDAQPMRVLPVPEAYNWLPASGLGGSQLELTNLYAAYARDLRDGTRLAPTFADALAMHELLDQIEASSSSGQRIQLK